MSFYLEIDSKCANQVFRAWLLRVFCFLLENFDASKFGRLGDLRFKTHLLENPSGSVSYHEVLECPGLFQLMAANPRYFFWLCKPGKVIGEPTFFLPNL